MGKQEKQQQKKSAAALVFPSCIVNNQVFVSVQVVEQVQLFRLRARSYHFSI